MVITNKLLLLWLQLIVYVTFLTIQNYNTVNTKCPSRNIEPYYDNTLTFKKLRKNYLLQTVLIDVRGMTDPDAVEEMGYSIRDYNPI